MPKHGISYNTLSSKLSKQIICVILQYHFKLAQLSYSEIRRHDAISYIHPTVCGMYRFMSKASELANEIGSLLR